MGRGIFGIDFGSVAFTLRKKPLDKYYGVYFRLHQRNFQYINPYDIRNIFLSAKESHNFMYDFTQYVNTDEKDEKILPSSNTENAQRIYYSSRQSKFKEIKSTPVAYWCPESLFDKFLGTLVGDVFDVKSGLSTGDNNIFVRNWYEISANDFTYFSSNGDWVPYNKGGGFRKWFGVITTVVKWGQDGNYVREYGKAVFRNPSYYFREGVTWTGITSGVGTFRYCPKGYIFDSNKGPMIFEKKEDIFTLLGFMNSNVANMIIKMLNPTVSIQIGDVVSVPYARLDEEMHETVRKCAIENIHISEEDWNNREISWGFKCNPLVNAGFGNLLDAWKAYEEKLNTNINNLRMNEELINSIYINAYDLGGYLNCGVPDEEITLSFPDIRETVKDFISYAIGCIMGRYSLDNEGLIFAGGNWNSAAYVTFSPDEDGILPITDDEYFEDDIVGRFIDFLKVVYGEESLEENLKFISDNLGGNGSSREVIRNYFINGFFEDHVKRYQKLPIYWLFDSGKKNGFKCLVYMHRYKPDTIARIRTDYVHEQQSRYRTAIAGLERQIAEAPTSERVRLNKRLSTLKDQAEEIRIYEEKIHHLADQMISIDLNDGIKNNYDIFKDVLAKIN